MAAPSYYYFFMGPAVAAVFIIVLNAFVIVFSSSVKELVVTGKIKREELERRIPTRRYERKEGNGEEECSVCLSAFLDGQRVRRLLDCNHCYHASCIDRWLMSHASCPICRADVLPSVRAKRAVSCGV
ncbi:RING-H2 finger protein ATL74-like [Dendrobium catenatum]|uniref:RING-H2 finger protein ATL74 n=1 Tax=Dendrobium catenatum TaxID=906689 RepID=A0A2I0W5V7_9ASPA|nr:RING-H2 finger protein ATL74-like [Dendrobium catenatum]PKU71030.1 RING-H2 finger protein ATL74 [Dendrobium catenatum]